MQVQIIIYPAIEGKDVMTRIAPRIGENVFFNGKNYLVKNVIHNFDERRIKVMVADF